MKIKLSKKKAVILSLALSLLLFFAIITFELVFYANNLDKKDSDTQKRYEEFEYELKNIVSSYAEIANGLYAYISTVNVLDEEEAGDFLDALLFNQDHNIRSIKIYKDTAELWDYTYDNGVISDLIDQKDEKASILYVKSSQNPIFQGPTPTSDESDSYILRAPINRGGAYWGQYSIIIDADKMTGMIRAIEEDMAIKVLITSQDLIHENLLSIIYGDNFVYEKRDLVYYFRDSLVDWKILVKPMDGWKDDQTWLILIPFIAILFSIFAGYKYYALLTSTKPDINHDQLTGLYNRNYLEKYAIRVFNIAKLNKLNVGIILITLDILKELSKTYGHETCEIVLDKFANNLKFSLRQKQEVFRIGGDEFLLVLEDVESYEVLSDIRDRLLLTVSGNMEVEDLDIEIKISAGISMYPTDGDTLELLLEKAYETIFVKSKSIGVDQ